MSLLQFFQTKRFRAFRASLFAALGLWGIVPGLHTLLLYLHVPDIQEAFRSDLVMGAVYLVSLSPEGWFWLYNPCLPFWLQPCLMLAVAFLSLLAVILMPAHRLKCRCSWACFLCAGFPLLLRASKGSQDSSISIAGHKAEAGTWGAAGGCHIRAARAGEMVSRRLRSVVLQPPAVPPLRGGCSPGALQRRAHPTGLEGFLWRLRQHVVMGKPSAHPERAWRFDSNLL